MAGKIKDLTGNRYGYLTAVRFIKTAKAGTYWELFCDCGNKVIRLASNVKKNHVHSCGCKPYRPAKPDAGIKRFFNDYKASARNRGYDFNLTESYFRKLVAKNCYYCGSAPGKRYEKQVVHTLLANGLDRVNNSKGYVLGNVVSCCKDCNRAKGSLTQKEFLTLIVQICENLNIR